MRLERATEEQKQQRDRITCEAWGQRLGLKGYLLRERRLRQHPWAQANMATWFLRAEGGEVLSSCETFRMPSYIDGVQEGYTYAVASVFTEVEQRGKGYAAELLKRVAEQLRQEDPSASAFVLYSDVPPKVYESVGYELRPAYQWELNAEPGDPAAGVDQLLNEDELGSGLASIPVPVDGFVVWPTTDQVDWHLERERIYAELLGRPRPKFWGARAGNSTAIWCGDLKHEHLNILLIYARDSSALQTLLLAACRVAHAAGLGAVHRWEEPPVDDPSVLSGLGMRIDRLPGCESLPMILPIGDKVHAEQWLRIPKGIWV